MAEMLHRLTGTNEKMEVYRDKIKFTSNNIIEIPDITDIELEDTLIVFNLIDGQYRFEFNNSKIDLASQIIDTIEKNRTSDPLVNKPKFDLNMILSNKIALIAILLFAGVLFYILIPSQDVGNQYIESNSNVYTDVTSNDMSDSESLTRDNSSAKLTTLYSGTFYVEDDLPEGRYEITGKGSGNLFIYSLDGDLLINEILGDESEYGVPSVVISLISGDKIEISGLESVRFKPADTIISSSLSAGYWYVGLDTNAGKYDAVPKNGESGNFMVYSSQGRLKYNEILGGSFGVNRVRVDLDEGDVIYISGLSRVSLS